MIGRELRLPPGPDPGLGARHDPGVGDQQINPPTRRQEPFGERGDTVEIAQIELVDLHTVDTCQRLGSRGGAAGRHHDTGAGADQGAGRLQPNARVAAGHHRQPASQIDAFEHVGGRRRGTEPGTDGALRGRHAATVRERERPTNTTGSATTHQWRVQIVDCEVPGYTSQPSDNTHPTWRLDPGAAVNDPEQRHRMTVPETGESRAQIGMSARGEMPVARGVLDARLEEAEVIAAAGLPAADVGFVDLLGRLVSRRRRRLDRRRRRRLLPGRSR